MTSEGGMARIPVASQPTSSWEAALHQLRQWDPAWAEQCVKMTTNPWTESVLASKFIELVCVGLNSARANAEGTRRHIRAALAAGASRDEILFVLKVCSVMAIHSCMSSAPVLLKEASAGALYDAGHAREKRLRETGGAAPAVEKMKALGQWSEEWDRLLFFAPVWTEQYVATVVELYEKSVLPRKQIELLCIAFDASYTQMYGPGMQRHIKNATKAGATLEEIVEVLKLCVIQGVEACNLGVPILAEELDRAAANLKTLA